VSISSRSTPSRPTQVLLLVDDKPGHSNQVEGLARIVAEHVDLKVERRRIDLAAFARGPIRRFIARHARRSRTFWVRVLFGIDLSRLTPPDVVITSGVKTLSAGRFVAAHFGAKLINCGLADSDDRRHCTAVLVPFTGFVREPNMVYCPTPNLVQPEQLSVPRKLGRESDFAGADASLLLGGPSQEFDYSEAEWRVIADFVRKSGSDLGIRWTVAGSRRTPDAASVLFTELARAGVCRYVDYRATGSLSMSELYSADLVVLTEDSLSMFCEALASRRPVCTIRPASVEASLQDEIVENALLKRQACRLRIADLDIETFLEAILRVEPSAVDYRGEIWRAVEPLFAPAAAR